MVGAPARVGANDLDDELRRVSSRVEAVANKIDDVTASRSNLAAEILVSRQDMNALLARLSTSETALGEIRSTVEQQSGSLESVRVELRDSWVALSETRAAIVGQRAAAIDGARAAYFNAGREIGVLSIASESITNISIGLEYMARANGINSAALATLMVLEEQEQRQQRAILDQEAQAAADLDRLGGLESKLAGVHAEVSRQREELQGLLTVQAHLLETLDEELAHFESELDGLELEQTRIKRRIATAQASPVSEVAPEPPSGLVRPVPGAVTSPYGRRYHPVLGYYRLHTGVDMSASYGQRIKALTGGVVILAGTWGGYGRTVVIDHGGGMSTLYAHQSSLSVSSGDTVAAGEVVGRVGTSGLSTGAHLHFEVRINGDTVDPGPYLGGR
jgi:murein DD-endopeptidase MepM/ murein hydrolase activator NlpD